MANYIHCNGMQIIIYDKPLILR